MTPKNDLVSRKWILDQFRYLKYFRSNNNIFDDMVSVVETAPSEGYPISVACCENCALYKPFQQPSETAIVGGCKYAWISKSKETSCSYYEGRRI